MNEPSFFIEYESRFYSTEPLWDAFEQRAGHRLPDCSNLCDDGLLWGFDERTGKWVIVAECFYCVGPRGAN